MITTGADVIQFLTSGVEFEIKNDDYDSINWFGKSPAITKEEYEAGFAQYNAWKAEQDAKAAADKAALLAKLGLTADEFKTLLGGN